MDYMRKSDLLKLEAFKMRCLLGLLLLDKIRNVSIIRSRLKMTKTIAEEITQRQVKMGLVMLYACPSNASQSVHTIAISPLIGHMLTFEHLSKMPSAMSKEDRSAGA